MGIRDRPITPGSPWQNGVADRLIGTLHRECLDQIVVSHLRQILSAYAAYYNQARTHLALQKDHRCNGRSSGLAGSLPFRSWPGLHHQYVRI